MSNKSVREVSKSFPPLGLGEEFHTPTHLYNSVDLATQRGFCKYIGCTRKSTSMNFEVRNSKNKY